jgi:hypothetical protein
VDRQRTWVHEGTERREHRGHGGSLVGQARESRVGQGQGTAHRGGSRDGEVMRWGWIPRRWWLREGGGASAWKERKARGKVWGTMVRGEALL